MCVVEQVTCSGLEFWGKKLHVQEARDNWERTFQWWLPTVGMAGYQMTYLPRQEVDNPKEIHH